MATTVSTSFEINGKLLTGLKFLKTGGNPSFLSSGRTRAHFQVRGKWPKSSERLIIFVIGGSSTSTYSVRSLVGIGSRWQDFLDDAVIRSNTYESDNRSLWSSTWMLKSPVRHMSSLDSITASRYSENSSVKLFTVTGWLIEYGGQKIQKKCVSHIQACKHLCYPWTKGPYHRLYDQFYDSGTVCSQVELSRSKRGSQ